MRSFSLHLKWCASIWWNVCWRKIKASVLSIDHGIIKVILDAYAWIKIKTLKIYQNSEEVLFIKELIKSPRTMGAVYPSSKRLAKRMAKEVIATENDIIVELGAGTGRVTKALLKRGISPSQLVVIEKSPKLAAALRTKFPLVSVIEGDAVNLLDLLHEHDQDHMQHIISSLPFRSLLPDVTNAIMQQIKKLRNGNTKLIQFTYSLHEKQPSYFANFKLSKSSIVWPNIPPARVNVFTDLG